MYTVSGLYVVLKNVYITTTHENAQINSLFAFSPGRSSDNGEKVACILLLRRLLDIDLRFGGRHGQTAKAAT